MDMDKKYKLECRTPIKMSSAELKKLEVIGYTSKQNLMSQTLTGMTLVVSTGADGGGSQYKKIRGLRLSFFAKNKNKHILFI